jgi:mannuronan 5-epimerase
MFSPPRILFALLLAAFIGLLTFFRFHNAIGDFASALNYNWQRAQGHISTTAVSNNYTLTIKSNKPSASIPALPDISRFTVDQIAAQVPPVSPGSAVITSMTGFPALREFINKDGRVQRLRLSQMAVTPQAIVIQSGHYDFTRLYEEISAQEPKGMIEKMGRRYLVRLPILVGEGATLTISDKDADEILLAQDHTVFLANAGTLFILRTKITGWNEKESHPAFYVDDGIFRPFLVSWSGGRMHIAGSTLEHLGYRKGKSYGITYSACDRCLRINPNLAPPTGTVIGNVFSGIYFGFYSYEAEDIAIIANKYLNNIVYGIDPHDRSRRLIIARNETSGSGKKHGIIISREVSDSWIFENYSHHNAGSGIMLDRSCEHNVIANNISAYNGGDGLTFFESPHNVGYNNKIYQNRLTGVRIRNSWNIRLLKDHIADNAGVPVAIYSASLEENHKDRNLEQDTYTQRADASIAGAVIKLPGSKPAFKLDSIDSLSLSNVHILSGGSVFSDTLFLDETDITKNIHAPGKMILVSKKSALTKLSMK